MLIFNRAVHIEYFMWPSKHIFSRYRHLLAQQQDSLVKTTIKILLICFFGFIGLFTCLLVLYFFQQHTLLLIRAFFLLLFLGLGLSLLLFKSPWTISAHIFNACLSLVVWSNILFFPS